MRRKELVAEKKKLENLMSSHNIKRPYESSSRWRQVKSQLDDKNNKRHWLVELFTIIGVVITFIVSIVALFKP